MLVFVLFVIYVGCRRDVPDHTSCGFVMCVAFYSGVVGTVDFLNKLYSFYISDIVVVNNLFLHMKKKALPQSAMHCSTTDKASLL